MSEVVKTVDSPGCPLVLFEPVVVAVVFVGFSEEVVEPVEEDAEPGSPEWVAFSEMGLELG